MSKNLKALALVLFAASGGIGIYYLAPVNKSPDFYITWGIVGACCVLVLSGLIGGD